MRGHGTADQDSALASALGLGERWEPFPLSVSFPHFPTDMARTGFPYRPDSNNSKPNRKGSHGGCPLCSLTPNRGHSGDSPGLFQLQPLWRALGTQQRVIRPLFHPLRPEGDVRWLQTKWTPVLPVQLGGAPDPNSVGPVVLQGGSPRALETLLLTVLKSAVLKRAFLWRKGVPLQDHRHAPPHLMEDFRFEPDFQDLRKTHTRRKEKTTHLIRQLINSLSWGLKRQAGAPSLSHTSSPGSVLGPADTASTGQPPSLAQVPCGHSWSSQHSTLLGLPAGCGGTYLRFQEAEQKASQEN
ncbi:hypothetical protein H1C71_039362 [Ictidomys tridecemlineatus]|nr:hypothetical protein H1C71_039362 [Ictidomys tridecemlineatus]